MGLVARTDSCSVSASPRCDTFHASPAHTASAGLRTSCTLARGFRQYRRHQYLPLLPRLIQHARTLRSLYIESNLQLSLHAEAACCSSALSQGTQWWR